MWSILDTGSGDGFYNMAVDEALLLSVQEGTRGPTLRFYRWYPPALSLGYFQKAAEVVNFPQLKAQGITLVRRLTGGRTVLHQEELTYSLILPEDMEGMPAGVIPSYAYLSQGILQGLLGLGLPVTQKEGRDTLADSSNACFEIPSWYEIQLGKKKMVGSAQIRKKGVLLQHGSIPLTLDPYLLFSLLAFPSEEERERHRTFFEKKATAINQELAEPVTYQQVQAALLAGWQETLSFQGRGDEITETERERVLDLKRNKYATREWNLYF